LFHWQVYGEHSTGVLRSNAGAYLNPSVVFFDNALGNPKSQASSNIGLGGEERLKKAGAVFGGNAVTVVRNQDAYSSGFVSA
jgi:hypothetical protein